MRSKKAIKNIIISLISQIIVVICGFIVPRFILQSFGSAVNGLISSITQFLGYITLLDSGIGTVIKASFYKPIANKDNKEIANILNFSQKFFRKLSYIFLIYLMILCIVYPMFINNEFNTAFTVSLILIIAISTFAEYFLGVTYSLFLQAQQKMYITSSIQIVSTIINAILTIVLIKCGANIQIVKLMTAFIFVIKPILQNLYVMKKYKINLKEAGDNYKLKNRWDGFAHHIAALIHNNTDITVLTLLTTLSEVSVYAVYFSVIRGVKNLVVSFRNGIDASFGDMIAKKEHEILNKNFRIYEVLYFTLITIVFICTAILIVPFVEVYTKGIVDVNYSRPLFAIIMVIAEFLDAIRAPYGILISGAGHFKETKRGAWIEAFTNIILSIILVYKFGIVGVAIGTLIAILIRTIEYMIHTSKHILKRDFREIAQKMFLIIAQFVIVYLINYLIFDKIQIESYMSWFVFAIGVVSVTTIIILLINCIVYKKEMKEALKLIKK